MRLIEDILKLLEVFSKEHHERKALHHQNEAQRHITSLSKEKDPKKIKEISRRIDHHMQMWELHQNQANSKKS